VRLMLRLLLWIAAIAVLALAAIVWLLVYRPLPRLDGTLPLPGLKAAVTVERDNWGVPHIRAANEEDMAEAQGYVVAQDRLWQMDLLRRAGRGQLSEVLGPATIEIDKDFRRLNFARAAQRDVEQMNPEGQKLLEAYARGVNQYIREHHDRLAMEFTLLQYKPQPWQPSDSLIIAGYLYRTLADTRHDKLHRMVVMAKAGPELSKDLFSQESSMDHFVVGDPNAKEHVNQAADSDDDPDDDEMGYDDVLKASRIVPGESPAADSPDLTSAMAANVVDWLKKSDREIRRTLGSNNWVVSGAHTVTGKPLLANDTHLELTLPPIWYEIHLTAPGWNAKGFAFPGAPLIVIGHNDHIAWGFTNNGADVMDLYEEKFNPANPDEYRVNKEWKKAEIFDEVIHVKRAPDEHMRLVVTRHGPVVVSEGDKNYAMRWTALEPGGLSNSYFSLGKAQNWAEFLHLMKNVVGPAQNAVFADDKGNIGYIMAAHVPVRKKGHGEVPVPGDTDDYEWTGYIPFDKLPQSWNPDSGLIVTANARVTGPDYKQYLTDNWEEPYRTARIYDLLHDKHDLRPEDMLKVQADTYSYPHVFLAEQLVAAARVATLQDVRAKKLIEEAKDWNGIADANSSVVSFLQEARRQALQLILEARLGEDYLSYDWRRMAFLQRILMERPSRWLPAEFKTYDQLLVTAADRAVKRLEVVTKLSNPDDWQWKRLNYLEVLHPLGRTSVLKKLLSVSNQPQSGTEWSPRAATPHHGPAMRFVANLADWDQSIMVIPGGQSGQPGSEHYKDQFSYWFDAKPIYAPFSDAAEAKVRKHYLTLKPE
jgi:penicillin G amidase